MGNTKLRRGLATNFLSPIKRRETQSIIGNWRMSLRENVISIKTVELLAEKLKLQPKSYSGFGSFCIFILQTTSRVKCTGENTLAPAPYLRPKYETYCKTKSTSVSFIMGAPTQPPPGKWVNIDRNSGIITLISENASLCNILLLPGTWRVEQVCCICL